MTDSEQCVSDTDRCHVCDDQVPVDGEHAMERFGEILCRDCSDEPVVFVAECSNGLCSWSYRVEENEFNRGHAKIRAQQEANQHETWKREFDEDPTHKTDVREVDQEVMTDGGEIEDGTDRYADWSVKECFKCGAEMRPHNSAYQPWDKEIMVLWKPASDDDEHVEETDSGGKHPNTTSRRFCSVQCLEAFIQMDYSLKPRSVDTGNDRDGSVSDAE